MLTGRALDGPEAQSSVDEKAAEGEGWGVAAAGRPPCAGPLARGVTGEENRRVAEKGTS